MKTCTKCGERKPLASYAARAERKAGAASACKSCERKRCREYRAANLEKEQARDRARPEKSRKYRAANSEKERVRLKRYYTENRERVLERCRVWAAKNLDKKASYRAVRRSAQEQRTPPWLTQAHLAEIEGQYHFAKVMEQITGQKYHVDHVEPLQGEAVSGLHVPWNLRAIPARDNIAKGNRRVEAHG